MTQTPDAERSGPVLPSRRGALGCSFGCGVFALVAILVAAAIAVQNGGFHRGHLPWTLVIGGGVVLVAGMALRSTASDEDRVNHACLGAPPLPVSLLEDGSRAFLRGRIVCHEPVIDPWWGESCAFVHIEQTKGSGKQKKTVWDECFAARAWIDDGSLGDLAGGTAGLPELDFANAKLIQIAKWSGESGDSAVTISFVRAGDVVSVAGRFRASVATKSSVVSTHPRPAGAPEDGVSAAPKTQKEKADVDFVWAKAPLVPRGGESGARALLHRDAEPRPMIGPDGAVPLVLTPLDRRAFAEYGEAEELKSRFTGTTAILVGSAAMAAGLGRFAGLCDVGRPESAAAAAASGVAVAVLLLTARELRRIRECLTRAAEASAALAAEMDRAERAVAAAADANENATADANADTAAAEARVTARLAVYEQLAAEYDDAISHFPMLLAARLAGHRPLLRPRR